MACDLTSSSLHFLCAAPLHCRLSLQVSLKNPPQQSRAEGERHLRLVEIGNTPRVEIAQSKSFGQLVAGGDKIDSNGQRLKAKQVKCEEE